MDKTDYSSADDPEESLHFLKKVVLEVLTYLAYAGGIYALGELQLRFGDVGMPIFGKLTLGSMELALLLGIVCKLLGIVRKLAKQVDSLIKEFFELWTVKTINKKVASGVHSLSSKIRRILNMNRRHMQPIQIENKNKE